jgi:hypothetical protein
LAGLALLALSAILSYREIQELIIGREASALSLRQYPVQRKTWLGVAPRTAVDYQFKDADGNLQKGHDEVDLDWHPPKDKATPIRYMPDGSSRLADHHDWLGVSVFAIAVICMVMARRKLLRPAVIVSEQKPRRKK